MTESSRTEHQGGVAVGEGSNDLGSSADFSHDPFQGIIGTDAPPMFLGEPVVSQGVFDALIDPFGCLGKFHGLELGTDRMCLVSSGVEVLRSMDSLKHGRDQRQLLNGTTLKTLR